MKKLTLLYILMILFSVAFTLPPYGSSGYEAFFTWKENRKLSWNDFQGKPNNNSSEVAMAASSVEFSYSTKNNQIEWTVTAKYYPRLSWSIKSLESDYILKHEQLHFDITELYTRLFRKQLKEKVHSAKDLAKLKSISNNILKKWTNEENNYDNETNHSVDIQKQRLWQLNIQERLDVLKDYSSK